MFSVVEKRKGRKKTNVIEYVLDDLKFYSDMLLYLFYKLRNWRSEIKKLAQSHRESYEGAWGWRSSNWYLDLSP